VHTQLNAPVCQIGDFRGRWSAAGAVNQQTRQQAKTRTALEYFARRR
jgi:hypothetical protein